jgi:alternate signal-mediated exported protein
MKKKILAIALVVAMLAVAIVSASLAYFTDQGYADNTFTIGNIEIELHEEFDEQNADLVPGVTITKKVTVANTSDTGNDAYVRVQIAILADLAPEKSIFDTDGFLTITKANEDWVWPTDKNNVYDVEMSDGLTYRVFTGIYKEALADDKTTVSPAIETVTLNPKADAYVVEGDTRDKDQLVIFLDGDGDHVWETGEKKLTITETGAVSIGRTNNVAGGTKVTTTEREFFTHILVRAEATQTTGMTDVDKELQADDQLLAADEYLDAAFGQPKDTAKTVWDLAHDSTYATGVINPDQPGVAETTASNSEPTNP